MTAALADLEPPERGWTTDDLDRLPEDGRRRELIDGVLIVSPSPTNIHQTVAGRLLVALEVTGPPEYEVQPSPLKSPEVMLVGMPGDVAGFLM